MNHHDAMRMNHPAFDFGHAGITFDAINLATGEPEQVWFSVDRFVEESEFITLAGESAILHTEAARLDISDIDATIRVTGI
jgi:hypothetical protein